MKEKWKVIERLISDEYGLKVQASYEGWGAGYDPKFLPLTEMWAGGELEEVPDVAKKPAGVVFHLQECATKKEEEAINIIRHEVEYLLNTDLYLWRLGQREFHRFGFTPTSFLVLYALFECIKADYKLSSKHPSSQTWLKRKYENTLNSSETYYPHHLFALSFLKNWLAKEAIEKNMERLFYQYLEANNKDAYNLLVEELLGRYMAYLERSQEVNFIDLLLDEARGKARKDAHKGRIMTDLLKKLPENLQQIIRENKDKRAVDIPEADRREILRSLKNMPDWMRDYLKQMSYLDLIERDVEFISNYLPKTLEVDLEHRGFLRFVIKPWEEQSAFGNISFGRSHTELSQEDKLYEKAYGFGKEEFRMYRSLLSNVLPYIEILKRKLRGLMPEEDEGWSGKYFYGKRMNNKSLSVEVGIGRGRFYMRRQERVRKELAFKLLIDISTSMKREDKIRKAIEALLLFSEVIHSLKMPFSIDVFSDRVFRLKAFDEDYREARSKIVSLFNIVGGGTNLEKAMLYASEDLESFCLENHIRGCMVVFSDGEPTKGIRGQELKSLIQRIKAMMPTIGIGVGKEKNYIDYYFDKTGIKIKDVSDLTLSFTRIIENQARRLLSFQ